MNSCTESRLQAGGFTYARSTPKAKTRIAWLGSQERVAPPTAASC
jgi:hypothetical protein